MKHLHYLLIVFLLSSFFFSCQKDTIEEIYETENILIQENLLNPELNDNASIINNNRGAIYPVFEGKMAWASFIIGKILFNDTNNSYRGYFLNKNTIQLEELIGETPFSNNFKTDFIDLLEYYIENTNTFEGIACPGEEEDKPGTPFSNDMTSSLFISYLIDDNCVELYFPINMDFSGEDTLTTLSHPLTGYLANEGIKHYLTNCESHTSTNVWVNPNYIFASGNINIIVLRPVINQQCSYSAFKFIITDFLYF